LSLVLLFFCAACLTTAAASGSMRSHIRLFNNENFFNYKYDYRVEWSRFISTLSAWDEDDVPVRVLRTLADLMDCPGGLLLVHRESWHRFMPLARWSVQGDAAPLAPDDAMLKPFADEKLSFLEIAPLSKDSAVQAWSQQYGFGWLV